MKVKDIKFGDIITYRSGRADVILMAVDELTSEIEKNMLHGDNLGTPKGILEDLKNAK